MNWAVFRKFNEIGAAARRARDQAAASKVDAASKKETALEKLSQATELEELLQEMNRRNHYSRGLTHAIRGRPSR